MDSSSDAVLGGLDPALARELEQRLKLATREDTARGLFFNGALDAVKVLGGGPAADRCKEYSGEKSLVDFFNYPIAGFLRLAFAAAQMMGPQLGGFDAAMRRMGMQATTDFLASAAGKTLLVLAGGNPRRLVGNLPTGYRAAVSYGERGVEWTGERAGRFFMKRDFLLPAYHEGVLQAVLESVGGKNVRVRGRQTGPLDAEYEISWD
ncbi:DUF2378 family protein [Myxococcaceae bacterium GXIMD 01537]